MLLKPALAGLLSLAQCIHGTLLGKLDSVPDCVDTIAHFSLQQYCSISVSASGNVNVAFKIDVNQSVNVPAPLQGFSQTTIQQACSIIVEGHGAPARIGEFLPPSPTEIATATATATLIASSTVTATATATATLLPTGTDISAQAETKSAESGRAVASNGSKPTNAGLASSSMGSESTKASGFSLSSPETKVLSHTTSYTETSTSLRTSSTSGTGSNTSDSSSDFTTTKISSTTSSAPFSSSSGSIAAFTPLLSSKLTTIQTGNFDSIPIQRSAEERRGSRLSLSAVLTAQLQESGMPVLQACRSITFSTLQGAAVFQNSSGGSAGFTATCQTDSTGSCSVSMADKFAETVIVVATYDSVPSNQISIQVLPLLYCPHIGYSVIGAEIVGSPIQVQFYLYDYFENVVNDAIVIFIDTWSATGACSGNVCTITPKVPGTVVVQFTISQDPLYGSYQCPITTILGRVETGLSLPDSFVVFDSLQKVDTTINIHINAKKAGNRAFTQPLYAWFDPAILTIFTTDSTYSYPRSVICGGQVLPSSNGEVFLRVVSEKEGEVSFDLTDTPTGTHAIVVQMDVNGLF